MKIAMGNDHSAVEMKEAMKAYVESKGYEVIDFGTNSTDSCDYPEFGEKVGRAVASGEADYGIADEAEKRTESQCDLYLPRSGSCADVL